MVWTRMVEVWWQKIVSQPTSYFIWLNNCINFTGWHSIHSLVSNSCLVFCSAVFVDPVNKNCNRYSNFCFSKHSLMEKPIIWCGIYIIISKSVVVGSLQRISQLCHVLVRIITKQSLHASWIFQLCHNSVWVH